MNGRVHRQKYLETIESFVSLESHRSMASPERPEEQEREKIH